MLLPLLLRMSSSHILLLITLTQEEYNRRVQVPDYKAEFQQLGTTISEGMKQAVESQNFTIQNQIRVDLDGRTIAENTSENQYREFKRG